MKELWKSNLACWELINSLTLKTDFLNVSDEGNEYMVMSNKLSKKKALKSLETSLLEIWWRSCLWKSDLNICWPGKVAMRQSQPATRVVAAGTGAASPVENTALSSGSPSCRAARSCPARRRPSGVRSVWRRAASLRLEWLPRGTTPPTEVEAMDSCPSTSPSAVSAG